VILTHFRLKFTSFFVVPPQRAEQMSERLFSEAVRDAMRKGTSSRWAADLTAEDLPALIWMVGEYGRRAGHILAALEEHWASAPPRDAVAAARAKLALEGMFRFFAGDRPSEAEYIARWPRIAERASARGHNRAPELPPQEIGELWPIVWEGVPVGSLKDPRHELFGCVGQWMPMSPASEAFAAVLGRLPQQPVVVSVGGVVSLIENPPSSSDELSVFWLGPEAFPAT
jgi:hypothetical protein